MYGKEAVLSSQIEGTQSSLQDLLAGEAQLFDQNLPRDVCFAHVPTSQESRLYRNWAQRPGTILDLSRSPWCKR